MGKDSYFDYILNKKIGFGKYQYFVINYFKYLKKILVLLIYQYY